jgi:hypothetical protein
MWGRSARTASDSERHVTRGGVTHLLKFRGRRHGLAHPTTREIAQLAGVLKADSACSLRPRVKGDRPIRWAETRLGGR